MTTPARRPDLGPIVVVTGSESTGKTTLAADLARRLGGLFVPEYARRYADSKLETGEALDASDVEPIARGTIALHDRVMKNARGLVVLDTDLVSTAVYARHYYGECPPWIDQSVRERHGDLYLLCDIDVPWVPGPHRDRPDARPEIHAMFAEAVKALGVPTVLIQGSWEDRFSAALAAIG
jgi:NadR type nicotinamide-nucleotide adenylyltransferase